MNPTPTIQTLAPKKLIGQRLSMSVENDKTAALWRGFTPRIQEIEGRVNQDKISLQVYQTDHFRVFDPRKTFEKWALVAVHHFENTPANMEHFELEGGEYAVFHHKGSSADTRIFQYIYSEWLPNSGYQLDNRPHFEVLGEKYKNHDPESEEEIWVPIIPNPMT